MAYVELLTLNVRVCQCCKYASVDWVSHSSFCLSGQQASQCFLLSVPFFSPLPLFFLSFFMSQMASAMLRGVSKYSLVHYWNLEVCQPLRRESCSIPRELTGREGKRGGIGAKADWERKINILTYFIVEFCISASAIVSDPHQDEVLYGAVVLYFSFDFFPFDIFYFLISLAHMQYESAGLSLRLAHWKADIRQVSESVFVDIEGGQGVFVVKYWHVIRFSVIIQEEQGLAVSSRFTLQKMSLCCWAWCSCVLNLLSP